MVRDDVLALLGEVARGKVSASDAAERLAQGPFKRTDLGFATLDHHRGLRHGIGEVVFGEGKTCEQLVAIVEKLAESGRAVLSTRLDAEKRAALRARFPGGRENASGRTFTVNAPKELDSTVGRPFVALLAAGTSDMPVAEEAFETCVAMGVAVQRVYDVGIAGMHRLLDRLEDVRGASALVVVAGMEGALPSVVAGLVARPVFAVPTSIGYGASFGGLAALLAMLNSCAPGVTVVNIDNGFSAAFAACNVVRLLK